MIHEGHEGTEGKIFVSLRVTTYQGASGQTP